MKITVYTLRILIGGLFIFSGLIKANDPLGLAYKMEEFFEIWNTLWLLPYAKTLSISMNVLEILSGVALWMGWNTKWNLRLLLTLIVFFTLLTGYTYYTGNPKTCGCFGDCLPIDSSISFYKDLALLGGILILIRYQHTILPLISQRVATTVTFVAAIFSIGLEYHVLNHLPLIDCLPYHLGQNIPEARKQPPPPPGSTVMFVYEKDGKEIEFSATDFPADFSEERYRFIRRYDTGEILQPKIQGLVFLDINKKDTTEAIFSCDRIFLVFSEDIGAGPEAWGKPWIQLIQTADSKKIPVVVITQKISDWKPAWRIMYPSVSVLAADRTPIRTAARVNPTLFYLKKGIIVGKWALSDFSNAENSL